MAYDNNAQQVPLSQLTPGMIPAGSGQDSKSPTPLLEAASEAIKSQNEAVAQAAATLKATPQTITGASASPQMPIPKPSLFGGASVTNLQKKQPTTAAGARSKGIGLIAAQGAGVISSFFKKKEAEKTQALAIDIHKSLELQQGMDEAKAVLAQDPNNAQAKATLQKNQTLMTALLSGKSGKDIAKAYDVTFGPEASSQSPDDKKKSMHHGAMQQALTQAQQDDRMKQFEAKMPERIQANPAYTTALSNYQKTQQEAQKFTNTYLTFMGKVATNDANDARASANRDAAGARTDAVIKGENQREADRIKAQKDNERERFNHESSLIGQRHKDRVNEIGLEKDAALKAKGYELYYTDMSKEVTETQKEIETKKADQKALNSSGDPKYADLQQDINDLSSRLTQQQNDQHEALGLMLGDPDAASMMSITKGLTKK